MDYLNFNPEGSLYPLPNTTDQLRSRSRLMEIPGGTILEHYAVSCDADHALHLDLPCGKAMIPREHCACGIAEGTTKEIAILSRVGKPVAFTVLDAAHDPILLSRRTAQEPAQTE